MRHRLLFNEELRLFLCISGVEFCFYTIYAYLLHMIERDLHTKVQQLSTEYPVVTITGPRQAGKTTLAKMAFPEASYCNLEHPETRTVALEDPKSFFMQYPAPVIIDEIQRAPQLLSYIQVIADEKKMNGLFILTGSQQLLLNASVAQSLAGRTALVTLLPFSMNEVQQFYKGELQRDRCIMNGFLPRIYDQNQEALIAYRNYLHTYVERDVRQLINLKDLYTFEKMLKLLAGRIGQLINLNSLANDTGVSPKTISHWLNVLEASYIVFRLQPYYENFGKRVIKSAKIYFYETGLASYLLGIEDEKQVARDPLLGGLFENMVVMECVKFRTNQALDPNLYFYRDSHHNEVDLILKQGEKLTPVEIKASQTYNPDFIKSITRFRTISESSSAGYVIYAGNNSFLTKNDIKVIGFEKTIEVFSKPL